MKEITERFRFAGERRQVTALFYDIVGSTELLQRSEPEQFFRSISALHQGAEQIIRKYGGFVHQRLGDGGCCYFGFPNQIEDAAESAVHASLELIETLGKSKPKHDRPLQLRIGVATSFVVFSTVGNELVGAAPILAARLQAEAEPNSVLVADTTVELTKTAFDYVFVKEGILKGFDTPIALFRPHLERAKQLTQTAGRSHHAPIRGREQELLALTNAWHLAREGTGDTIVLSGEAGIGKSRVVDELVSRASPRPEDLAILQCGRRLEGQPLYPLMAFIERILGKDLSTGDTRLADLVNALGNSGRKVDARLLEPLGQFLTNPSTALPGNLRVSDLSGQVFRQAVIAAAAHVLTSNSPAFPSLIIVEDIHWADDMTLTLLEHLREEAGRLPILLVQTARINHATSGAHDIALGGLAADPVRELVASIWGEQPPPGLSDFILEQSDGMPLYGEQLARYFKTRHAEGEGPFEWKRQLTEGGVASLNDLLSARLAECGSARLTAQIASVIGREFSLSLLAHLLADLPRQTIEIDVNRLAAHGIVEPLHSDKDVYRFRHVLMQEATYGTLLKADRRRIHLLIAERLRFGDTAGMPPAIAAWQCAEAGLHEGAARFAIAAAEASVSRSAMSEARISMELCATQLKQLTRPSQRRTELMLRLMEVEGVVTTALEGEGSTGAQAVYSRAMQVLRKQPPEMRMEHFPIYWGWWFTAPNVSSQQSRARVLVADMESADDDETRLQSFHCGWATSFHAGEHEFCLDCVAKGLKLYDAKRAVRNRAFFGGHDSRVCGLGESALSHLLLGHSKKSEEAIGLCLDWAKAADHPGTVVHALYYAMVLRKCQDRFKDVEALGEQMASLADRHGLQASQARANMYRGWAELMSTSGQRGEKQFRDGLALQQERGTDDNLSIHSDMHAEVLETLGELAAALDAIDAAIAAARTSGQLFWLAELHRRRAGLQQRLGGDKAQAKIDLKKAVRIADGQKARWLSFRANADLENLK